jgi:hypothetical protein
VEEISNHPAVLVLVGVFGRNAADAEDLSFDREIRRAVLSTSQLWPPTKLDVVGRSSGVELVQEASHSGKCWGKNSTGVATYQNDVRLGHGGLEHSELLGATLPRRPTDRHGRWDRCQRRRLF